MLFDTNAAQHLKPWLVRTLEPICDAEPGALAEYILALLKHNAPESEMRKELTVQLEEFLEKECAPFINTLFTVLRTKSYLPYTAADPPPSSLGFPSGSAPAAGSSEGGIPIPIDVLIPGSSTSPDSRGRKRSLEPDPNADGRIPKGPRMSEGQYSRHQNGRSGQWSGHNGQNGMGMDNGMGMGMGVGAGMGMGMGMGMNGRGPQQGYQPPDRRKGLCRDYHSKGYCSRGAMCKYSHGDEAMMLSQMQQQMFQIGLPFLPFMPNGGMPFMPGAQYDPREAQMDIRPVAGRQRAPLAPRGEDGVPQGAGELPVIQDLTPQQNDQQHGQRQNGNTAPNVDGQVQPPPASGPMDVEPAAMGTAMGMGPQGMMGMNTGMAPPGQHHHPQQLGGHTRGGSRGGRGVFNGDAQSFRPGKRVGDKTLVVEKIPEEKLALESVNDWFKRFGTVTNVAIDARSAKALVSFAEHDQAHAAWKSEDAVFGNRFVKVFWHRPMEGHGEVGRKALAASATAVAGLGKEVPKPTPAPTPKPVDGQPKRPVAASQASQELAAKQKLLEGQIEEQKKLMAELATASADEKKTIMARLRKLGEEMTAPSSSSKPSTPTPESGDAIMSSVSQEERSKREQLDKELEMHGAGESTEDLKATLAKLKEEAASLGIAEQGEAPPAPWRGRGRGRARGRAPFYRGAAWSGPPRGSMKLDNRPKKLLLKGVSANNVQAVRDWYELSGQVDSVETGESDEVVVAFKTRAAAEQALAKGQDVPSVGQVQISWHATAPPPSGAIKPQQQQQQQRVSKDKTSSTNDTQHDGAHEEGHDASHNDRNDEEVVASGWGAEGDDGMGMM
ncbi:hypothetical protein CONPUDRAFT_133927 [Coniophora puteana RWD-64-598 SS2]|uniref:C3H1-type domain-containing protein n=1 Tax=Coniophora puteana (strain RWD-64-598) TaxID=741705 RepID=A0A5M3N5C2_CONPW|nr:uncharacterized protein CONPUDRAFT_133927 [Coniophora puteana RWD-64-598 SS2]EIW86506.1 hypothetical protein CONPUDRAFT_133927 [Coniophora puteana RWD-64-598 SS2]